jgi:predicted metalloprotease
VEPGDHVSAAEHGVYYGCGGGKGAIVLVVVMVMVMGDDLSRVMRDRV